MPANLNRKQQREIKAVVERAKKDNGIPQTAQQSIPFQRMFPDGICRVTDSYVTNSGEGEGLLFYGNVILPFIDRFPTDLELYRIMTTKLNEVAQEKEA